MERVSIQPTIQISYVVSRSQAAIFIGIGQKLDGMIKGMGRVPWRLVISTIIGVSLPLLTQAALVPCTGTTCQLCYLEQLGQNLANFSIGIMIPIAVILIVWAGLLYFSSGVKPANIERARKIFGTAIVGFLITICAWLIVQTVLNALQNKNFWGGGGNWYTLQCSGSRPMSSTFGQLLQTLPKFGTVPPLQPGQSSGLNSLNSVSNPSGGGMSCPSGYSFTGSACMNSDGDIVGVTNPASFDSRFTGASGGDAATAINTYFNSDTSTGPNCNGGTGGQCACAWAVNNVLALEGMDKIDGDSVALMQRELQNGRGIPESQANAQTGDIVVWKSDTFSHVGMCVDAGCTQVVSNSSGDAKFNTITDVGFNQGRSYEIYRPQRK